MSFYSSLNTLPTNNFRLTQIRLFLTDCSYDLLSAPHQQYGRACNLDCDHQARVIRRFPYVDDDDVHVDADDADAYVDGSDVVAR